MLPRWSRRIAIVPACACVPLALVAQQPNQPQAKSLPQQIADVMVQINGGIHTGFRFTHAKGIIATGTFTPAPSAKSISSAAHLQGAPAAVTVRFSDGTGNPQIPDANPNAAPHGIAVRFMLPGAAFTDIVANSHNGFFVGTGDDFLAMLKAVAATTPKSPHPSPIEQFFGSHPRALKVATDSKRPPTSFARTAFYGNNAFVFIDSTGKKRAGRYQIIPVAGIAHLDSAAAAKATPTFLFDDLPKQLAKGPVKYQLFVQLANPGDQTKDGSMVWPSDRKRVLLGTISVTTIAPKNDELQRSLAFNPIYLTKGIELSDDPLVPLRSAVYALSVAHRH
jgi:catalase